MRKKLLSIALALVTCLGLAVPAFAAEETARQNPWRDGAFNNGVYEGYYAQLDDLQKMLYDKIKEAFAEPAREVTFEFDEPILVEAEAGVIFTEDDLYQWMRDNMCNDRGGRYAVFRDHPELPWLLAVDYGVTALGEYIYNDRYECIGFRMTGMFYENTYPWVPPEAYTNPSALEQAADTAIAAIGEARPSRAATVRAIHDYLCGLVIPGDRNEVLQDKNGGSPHTVYYDQTSYSALVSPNTSICNGYSAAFKLLCDRYGIPCVHLSGKCLLLNGQEGNHAWNYVQLEDGNWYAVDPTWDDGEPIGYDHFLVGKNTVNSAGVTFAYMHETPPYNNYLPACPALSDTAYPYLEAKLADVPESIELGNPIQLQLNEIKDLEGNVITNVNVGLFEGDSQTPIATGRIHNGSVSLDYSESKLGIGRHTLYVKCTGGKQKGAILAAAEITLKSNEPVVSTSEFTDVSDSSFYAEAVKWAVERKITVGTSTTTFSPDQNCTNAQILTFLWRAYGEPEPTIGNPYTNSIPTAYAKAAVWAYEKGMVSGTAFDVDKPCTRAMAVTYMWQAAGSPMPSASAAGFTDIPADAPYAPAVSWASEKGITNGTSTTIFSPDEICNRGQIVTLLHRNLA